jgi:hypothetical protein
MAPCSIRFTRQIGPSSLRAKRSNPESFAGKDRFVAIAPRNDDRMRRRSPGAFRVRALRQVVLSLSICTATLAESDQPSDKRPAAEASIELQPIVVREKQKLPSGFRGYHYVPAERQRERDRFGQALGLARIEPMAGCIV